MQPITSAIAENVDFIDALNAAWLLAQNMQTVCTFDRKHFSQMGDLTVLVPGQSAQ